MLFNGFQQSWTVFMAWFCLLLKSTIHVYEEIVRYLYAGTSIQFKCYTILFMLESVHYLWDMHDLSFLFFEWIARFEMWGIWKSQNRSYIHLFVVRARLIWSETRESYIISAPRLHHEIILSYQIHTKTHLNEWVLSTV